MSLSVAWHVNVDKAVTSLTFPPCWKFACCSLGFGLRPDSAACRLGHHFLLVRSSPLPSPRLATRLLFPLLCFLAPCTSSAKLQLRKPFCPLTL